MFENIVNTIKKKSLRERFLLVIRILFFLIFIIIGFLVLFWKKFPIVFPTNYKWVIGIMLVYSFIRLRRFFNSNNQ
jgi:uncharacterized membrane protein